MRKRPTKARKKRSVKKKLVFFVDGDTEKWYLDSLKGFERLDIDIAPRLPTKKTLKDTEKELSEICQEADAKLGDKVIWIVDLDVPYKEDREGNPKKLNDYKRIKTALLKRYPKVFEVWENFPCLEFWLLLHYKQTQRCYLSYNDLLPDLKKHLVDYKKTENYYKSSKKGAANLYALLKPNQKAAYDSAKLLKKVNEPDAAADIYKLIDLVGL